MELYVEEILDDDDDNIQQHPPGELTREDCTEGVVHMHGGGEICALNMAQFGKPMDSCQTIQLAMTGKLFISGEEIAARGGAAMNSVANGNVYIFGGANRTGNHYNDLWCSKLNWNNTNVRWDPVSATGTPPAARSGHCGITIDSSRILYFGGLNSAEQKVFNDVHIYDANANTWEQITTRGASPQGRTEHSGVLVQNSILFFGGSSPECGPLRDIQILSIDTFTWSTMRCDGIPPIPREMHSAILIGTVPESPLQFATYRLDNNNNVSNTLDQCEQLKTDGNALFVSGKFAEACEIYTKALSLNPQLHTLYSNRSACYLSLNQPQEALADALKAIALQPNWSKGYIREAMALSVLKDQGKARSAYEYARELATSENERSSIELKIKAMPGDYDSLLHENGTIDSDGLYMVVYGGRALEGVLDDIRLLDLKNSKWLDLKIDTPFPRCGHSCSGLPNGQFMIFGGWDGGPNVYDRPVVYDLNTRMWTECYFKEDKTLGGRFSHCSLSTDDYKTFIFGGVSFQKDFSDVVAMEYKDE